jgi:hypothetical protein
VSSAGARSEVRISFILVQNGEMIRSELRKKAERGEGEIGGGAEIKNYLEVRPQQDKKGQYKTGDKTRLDKTR